MYHNSLKPQMFPVILACFLLCYGYIENIEAGKGKGSRQGHIIIQNEIKDQGKELVPIYMPIPIPVPMPVSPPEGNRHQSQHIQHQHHHNRHHPAQQYHEDEGEVKKIYLLQPIARPNPPPKQPVYQTQVHMNPPPLVAPPRFQMQSPQYEVASLGGAGGGHPGPGQEEYHSQQTAGLKQGSVHNMHSNDMKILPIVVIPPIAPMQPIQLQPNAHQSTQRVSVGSQINNYVSTMEPPYLGKPHRSQEQYHDFKTFSEYGGSGGGALFRENLAPRRLRIRAQRVHMQPYRMAGSRVRPRYSEDFLDDYDYGAPPPPMVRHHRIINNVHPYRPMMSMRMKHRRRPPFHPEQTQLRMAPRNGGLHDSIRDLIDQQVHFDDGDESRNQARQIDNLTADNTDTRDSIATLDDSIISDSVAGTKKQDKQTSRIDHHRRQQDVSNQLSSAAKYSHTQYNGGATTKQASDLTYYEHDIPQSNSEFDSQKEAALLQSSNRMYADEREALEDDEWWFDTIKSVSHASPASSNQTTTSLSPNNNNSTSTTTLAPMNP